MLDEQEKAVRKQSIIDAIGAAEQQFGLIRLQLKDEEVIPADVAASLMVVGRLIHSVGALTMCVVKEEMKSYPPDAEE